jgi:hypothetical protein
MLEPKRPARRSRGPGRAPTYLVYRLSTYFVQLRSRSKLAARLPSCAPIPLRRVDPRRPIRIRGAIPCCRGIQ